MIQILKLGNKQNLKDFLRILFNFVQIQGLFKDFIQFLSNSKTFQGLENGAIFHGFQGCGNLVTSSYNSYQPSVAFKSYQPLNDSIPDQRSYKVKGSKTQLFCRPGTFSLSTGPY